MSSGSAVLVATLATSRTPLLCVANSHSDRRSAPVKPFMGADQIKSRRFVTLIVEIAMTRSYLVRLGRDMAAQFKTVITLAFLALAVLGPSNPTRAADQTLLN